MSKLQFPLQTHFYSGKVRDIYFIGSEWLVMVASNRISAFDVILPKSIPYKGQVLNQVAAYMLGQTADICPNWLVNTPVANVAIGKLCEPYKVEVVVRGNLTGHAWRTYRDGKRVLCGVELQAHLRENDFFPSPIITPTTKASAGHDEDISRDEIVSSNLVGAEEYAQLEKYALALFARGKEQFI
jgi:phosphoribosylaminoimidazole-succinocarboxamide synthase